PDSSNGSQSPSFLLLSPFSSPQPTDSSVTKSNRKLSQSAMAEIEKLLICAAVFLLQANLASTDCYNGTHFNVRPGFPTKMPKCTPTTAGNCYEILHKFTESLRLFMGCDKCPDAIKSVKYDFGAKKLTISDCSETSGSGLSNTKWGNKIKSYVLQSEVCSFEDATGSKGTILCKPKENCMAAVMSTTPKKRFRGCASNCKEFKLSDCRECKEKSCDHPAFDSAGNYIKKSGAMQRAAKTQMALGVLFAAAVRCAVARI
ncbi:hypothetical protein BOX15_Mlig006480g2, partial [Macrostomum lignano]